MFWAQQPSRAEKNHQEYNEKTANQPERRIVEDTPLSRRSNSGYLRHFCLVAVRWGLVRHLAVCCS